MFLSRERSITFLFSYKSVRIKIQGHVTSKSRLIIIGKIHRFDVIRKCTLCKCLDETFDFVVDKLNFRRDLIKSIHCCRGEVTHPCATHSKLLGWQASSRLAADLFPLWIFTRRRQIKPHWLNQIDSPPMVALPVVRNQFKGNSLRNLASHFTTIFLRLLLTLMQ